MAFMAGLTTGSQDVLSIWLSQEIWYTEGYKISISRLRQKTDDLSMNDRHQDIYLRLSHLLQFAEDNMFREAKMFESMLKTAARPIRTEESYGKAQRYLELFESSSDEDHDLLYELTVLWATEICFLESWTYLSILRKVSESGQTPKKLVDLLISNWTNQEFRKFVNEIADVLDNLVRDHPGYERSMLETAWWEVLKVEAVFWPQYSMALEVSDDSTFQPSVN
jgi:thiaminase